MMTLSTQELKKTLKSAESIARSAGALLREAHRQPRQIEHKGTVIDLITQADLASEKAIVDALREQFPDYAILAEEGGEVGGGNGCIWMVDPLDGTTNFAHAFPVFSVSIALRSAEGPLLGVVYDPLRDECFTAARGQGAALNGQPVRPSSTSSLGQALVATGFPYDRHTAEQNNAEAFVVFVRRTQGVRRVGSAALDLCYVACGRLDGFWEMRLNPWDVTAGALIVREAGGMITNYAGEPDHELALSGKQIIASNGPIHDAMVATLGEIYAR
jgi:myo-inositol-1(or 4)-monophosphatase